MKSSRFRTRLIVLACLVSLAPVGLRSASAQESEAATRQYAAAVGIQNLKQYSLAVEEWETFLKKFPKDPRVDKAQHYLGTCALQDKQFTKAIDAFQVVVTKHPKFELMDQTLLNLGISWYGVAQKSEKGTDYAKAETASDFDDLEVSQKQVPGEGSVLSGRESLPAGQSSPRGGRL